MPDIIYHADVLEMIEALMVAFFILGCLLFYGIYWMATKISRWLRVRRGEETTRW